MMSLCFCKFVGFPKGKLMWSVSNFERLECFISLAISFDCNTEKDKIGQYAQIHNAD